MNTINEILKLIDKKNDVEQQLKDIDKSIKDVAELLDLNECQLHDYDTLKKIYKEVSYKLEGSKKTKLEEVLYEKKTIKYPALLKPTFYPEIDSLNMSDSEKLRLDKLARKNERYYMPECRLKDFGFSLEDIELLIEMGIVEKHFQFECSECGETCVIFPERVLNEYKLIWNLEAIKDRTAEEENTLSQLYVNNTYGCIELCCMECDDFFVEITDEKDLNNFAKNISIVYKIVKEPNTAYERL